MSLDLRLFAESLFEKSGLNYFIKDDETCLISLGETKLNLSVLNRRVIFFRNKYLSDIGVSYFQKFDYSKELDILLVSRLTLKLENTPSIYFCPHGRILNDFKDSGLIKVGLNFEDLFEYFNYSDLRKLRSQSTLRFNLSKIVSLRKN